MFSKSAMVVSSLVVLLGVAMYPAIIHPRMHPDYYSKLLIAHYYNNIFVCSFAWNTEKTIFQVAQYMQCLDLVYLVFLAKSPLARRFCS